VHHVVGVSDGVLGESLWWWSNYIVCNSDHPNEICNKNFKKNIRGSTTLTKVTRHQCAHPRWEGCTLQMDTLRQERRLKLETGKERRAQ
jgi:hypothetical protein